MASKRPSPRPTFELRSELDAATLARKVQSFITKSKRIRGVGLPERLELAITGEDHHFWSPQLVVKLVPDPKGGTVLQARFGPDPYVWGMYVFAYGLSIWCVLFAMAFGVSQWMAKASPTGLLLVPVAAVLAGLVYGASFVGQGLGSEQMYFLRASLVEITGAKESENHALVAATTT